MFATEHGLLYMLGLLQTSGNFRIYEPGVTPRVEAPPPPRAIEGRFAPITGKALLMVGPDADAANAYFDKVVSAPGGVNLELTFDSLDFDALAALAKRYPNSVLSVGLSFSGQVDSILAGEADSQIDSLLAALASYPRPVFLRLGPEFDAAGSGYAPESYVSAWKYVHQRVQAAGAQNIALAWHTAGACETPFGGQPPEAWYPGDAFVDWVAVSYREQVFQCENQPLEFVLNYFRERSKPVMIVAVPPAQADWPGWFAPLFGFIRSNNDVTRALLYWNADSARWQDVEFLRNWKAETAQPFWLRASPGLFDTLQP